MARRVDGNGLRSPTLEESKNLPTSIEEAKSRGLNVYTDESGTTFKIRFKTRKKPDQYGLRAEYEDESKWRGRNDLQPLKRQENERLSTPPGSDRKAYNKAMSDARKQGMQGDHKYSVARTGNALREMSPDRQQLMHQRFKDANIPLGNQAGNIEPLDSYTNEVVKQAQERAVDKGISNVKGSFKGLDLSKGAAKMKFGLSMIAEFLPAIDEITGGHLTGATPEKAVADLNSKIDSAKIATSQKGRMCLKNGAVCLKDFGLSELIGLNTRL